MSTTDFEAFRSTAETYLDEALCEELSLRIRTDAAFDACYMYCRAAERLGWSAEVMTTAIGYLDDWHAPMRGNNRYDQLLAIALRLKEALDSNEFQTRI